MSEPTVFKCPNCASPLRVEDWDTANGILKCSYCRSFSTVPGHSQQEKKKGQDDDEFRPRKKLPLPPGLKIEETPRGLVLTRRWFTPVVLLMIPFCLVWNGFLVFWYTQAFHHDAPWLMVLFPIFHVTIGVWLAYTTVATLINSTRIRAEGGQMGISHYPLPWRGNLTLDTSGLRQFFCMEIVHNRKNGRVYSYEVWASLADGNTRKIVGAALTRDQALFIEQALERALGMEDRPVPGELRR